MKLAPEAKQFKPIFLAKIVKNPSGYLAELHKQYGDIFQKHFLGNYHYFLAHPKHAEHVLSSHQDNYGKNPIIAKSFAFFVGEDNLTTTNNIKTWRQNRTLSQISLDTNVYFEKYARVITKHCHAMLNRWKENMAGFSVPFAHDMNKLVLNITCETLFYKLNIDVDGVVKHIPEIFNAIRERSTSLVPLTWILPTAKKRRFQREVKFIHDMADKIVASRLYSGKDYDDVLGTLLHAYQVNQLSSPNFRLVSELVSSLMLAGFAPTSSALRWVITVLSQRPDIEKQIAEEVAAVCRHDVPDFADLTKLKFTQAVVCETLRLYPPLIFILRQAIGEDEISGYTIPANAGISLNPVLIHRHPDYWEKPDEFLPERFLAKPWGQDYQYAYIPFGAGNRGCMGKNLGFMICCLVVAMVVQRFKVALPKNVDVGRKYVGSMFQMPGVEEIMVSRRS